MPDFQTLHEIVKAARANTTDAPWDYLTGGAETETTQLRNRLAIDSLGLRPRVLRNVNKIDTSSTLLGKPMRMPVFIAPMGSLQMLDPSAGLGVSKAAESFGIVSMLSSVVPPGLEVVGNETRHPKVYQLYVRGDRAWVDDYVKRAIEHRYDAFCFTLDTAIYGRRERDMIKRHVPAGRLGASGFEFQADMTWELIEWFKKKYPKFPLVLKGIANADDAKLAVEHGAEVVYVSNHGGRQLDQGLGTIAVLQEVLQAVGNKTEVVVDGGFLRGTDVVKAIALGAKAVGIARLVGFGLAAGGEAGVLRMLEILETEIRMAMGLLGVTSVDQLNTSHVREAPPVRAPHALYSAFPFLELPVQRY